MDSASEIREIQVKIQESINFHRICKVFSEEMIILITSSPGFYNQIFKESNLNSLSTLLGFCYSDEISSMTEFYSICSQKRFGGKNKTLALLNFMDRGGYLSVSKEKDRRRKNIEITDKGRKILDAINTAYYPSMKLFDNIFNFEFILSDEGRRKYYTNFLLLSPPDAEPYDVAIYLAVACQKTSGFALILMIYREILSGRVLLNVPVRGSYFRNLSMDLGISASHVNNIIEIFLTGDGFEKNGSKFIVKSKFINDTEKLIALYMAFVYFYMTS